jgi:hypothetical protein
MMKCKEFKQWMQDHETVEMTDSVHDHLESCSNCQQIFTLDQQLDEKLRTVLQPVEVPELLRERLDQNLSGAGYRKRRYVMSWKKWVPALATAALLVFLILPFTGRESSFSSMDQLSQYAITDHTNHGLKDTSVFDLNDLGAWAIDELGYSVSWPEVPGEAKLIGATKCRLGNCDTVHLIYSQMGSRFSIYVFSEKKAAFSMAAGRVYTLKIGKHNVKMWKSGNQVQAMVS